MENDNELRCFDCSSPYEDTEMGNRRLYWFVDLLYNGKIVGRIKADTREEVVKLRLRWYNGDK